MTLPACWRRLLLYALMLALPLQSLAASAMAGCAWTSGAEAGLEAEAAPAQPDCHEAAAATPADHRCSVCTVCALVGALPDAPPTVPAVKPDLPTLETPAARVTSVPGSRLDRPPRARG